MGQADREQSTVCRLCRKPSETLAFQPVMGPFAEQVASPSYLYIAQTPRYTVYYPRKGGQPMLKKYLHTAFYRYWLSVHTVRHFLFAPFALLLVALQLVVLLLAALPLIAEAQDDRTPAETATMSHSATSISLQPPKGPPWPVHFLSHKVNLYPHPGSTIFDDTNYARDSGNCTNVPSAVLIGVHGMFGNGHLNGGAISVTMRTCGSHTVGETFRMSWSGDSSKAWRSCQQTEYGQSCGYSRSGNGTPARAYFAFGPGPNCTVESVVTTQMGTVRGATSCWTTVTIQ